MSVYLLSGRIAQVLGLALGIFFAATWVGAQTELPLISSVSRAFVEANGTPNDMLFFAGVGLFIFAVGTVLFALLGGADDFAKNQSDLRKSGWR